MLLGGMDLSGEGVRGFSPPVLAVLYIMYIVYKYKTFKKNRNKIYKFKI